MRRHFISLVLIVLVIMGLSYINKHPEGFDETISEESKETITAISEKAIEEVLIRSTNVLRYFGLKDGTADESKLEIKATKGVQSAIEVADEIIDKEIDKRIQEDDSNTHTTTESDQVESQSEVQEETSIQDESSSNIVSILSFLQNKTCKLEPVTLIRVVDGDTIIVNDINGKTMKVRLIGIDTPESVNPDKSKNTEFGNIASEYTKNLLKGYSNLYLQYDRDKTDKYDRTLAYVWLSEPSSIDDKDIVLSSMLNAILLENGYAIDKEYKPNIKYTDMFKDICHDAQINRVGLWNYEEFYKLVG